MPKRYQPNFADPRVQRRLRHAIGFVKACFCEHKDRAWSKSMINQHVGQAQHPLGQYLRHHLLICTNHHWQFGVAKPQCKSYRINPEGLAQLQQHLEDFKMIDPETSEQTSTNTPSAVDWVRTQYRKEFDQQRFHYNEKSNRYWHPLQNVRGEIKRQALALEGYRYHYDIESCAPTLLLQYSQQISPEAHQPITRIPGRRAKKIGPMDLYLPNLQGYLANKHRLRQYLSECLEIPEHLAKRLITAMMAGASVSKNNRHQIFRLLESDEAKIVFLQEDPQIIALRSEIKTMWDYITPVMPRRINDKTGKLVRITSLDKWRLYFQLEHHVISCIRNYLRLTDNPCFTEHDGWSCVKPVDLDLLRLHVRDNTGYDLKFSFEKIDSISERCENRAEYIFDNSNRFITLLYNFSENQPMNKVTPQEQDPAPPKTAAGSRRGRPKLGSRPLTPAEKQARDRERIRQETHELLRAIRNDQDQG